MAHWHFVDTEMPIVILAPNDEMLDKLKSNMEEVQARGGELFVFADENSGVVEKRSSTRCTNSSSKRMACTNHL